MSEGLHYFVWGLPGGEPQCPDVPRDNEPAYEGCVNRTWLGKKAGGEHEAVCGGIVKCTWVFPRGAAESRNNAPEEQSRAGGENEPVFLKDLLTVLAPRDCQTPEGASPAAGEHGAVFEGIDNSACVFPRGAAKSGKMAAGDLLFATGRAGPPVRPHQRDSRPAFPFDFSLPLPGGSEKDSLSCHKTAGENHGQQNNKHHSARTHHR